jgi:hypothetical protein
MAGQSPLTDADKAYIREAYTRQESHRDIAAHLGRAKTTVGSFMKREGLLYDSTNQQAAITKNVLTAQERISALRLDVIGIAEHEAQEIRQVQRGEKPWKTVLKETGGAERVHQLDFIPPQDKRANANSLGSHAATIARLAPKEDGGSAEVDSVMDRLITGLQKAYEGQDGATP